MQQRPQGKQNRSLEPKWLRRGEEEDKEEEEEEEERRFFCAPEGANIYIYIYVYMFCPTFA